MFQIDFASRHTNQALGAATFVGAVLLVFDPLTLKVKEQHFVHLRDKNRVAEHQVTRTSKEVSLVEGMDDRTHPYSYRLSWTELYKRNRKRGNCAVKVRPETASAQDGFKLGADALLIWSGSVRHSLFTVRLSSLAKLIVHLPQSFNDEARQFAVDP